MRKEVLAEGVELWLGNCMDVMQDLPPIDHLLTDPPFEKEAHTPGRRTQASIRDDTIDAVLGFDAIDEEMRNFIPTWAKMRVSGWLMAFCQVEAVSTWRDAMEAAGLKYKRGMAWVKPDSTPQFNGRGPAQGFECIALAWCGEGHSSWNAGGKRGVYVHLTNPSNRDGTHPTEKPSALMSELVRDFTDPGQTILDPFMGSCSTGIAAVKSGRKFIGIEMDEKFFELSLRRMDAALKQADLFVAVPKPAKQEAFI
jgi:site-specific DNA-methyltransferase (adenine-specific)